MKKIIIFSFLFYSCNLLLAQVSSPVQIVNDPTNLAKIKEIVKSGEETVSTMKKQIEYIEQAKDQLEKVNSYVRQASTTKKALDNAKRLTTTITQAHTDLSKLNLDAGTLDSYSQSLDNLYEGVLETVSDLTVILTDGSLKMSDAERLRIIKEKEEDLAYKEMKIKRQVEKAKMAYSRQETLKVLSNGGR